MLQHGHQISQDLRRVKLISEAIPHRHACEFAKFLDDRLAVAAIFDAVIHAPQYAGGVFHRLLMANLRAARPDIRHLRALIERADFKRAAGTGGGFFKNQRDVFAHQRFLLAPGFFIGFQLHGEIDEVLDLRRGIVE